ncbi:MAG: methyltransferase [Firmicutes bacterium HGW-Firmicutes-14]|nr:MAG: methyltransferase [Firmicutes bacterium HGW-Firmicutes-14]
MNPVLTKETEIELSDRTIRIKVVQNSEEILTGALIEEETPVWVELWPSSLALAQWISTGPDLNGVSVLELGAGLGLPGIVAGIKGASVLQTDYMEEALEVARQTAVLNNVPGIRTAVADWRDFNLTETFDYIIGSDILYHPNLNPFLKKIFVNNLRPGGTIIMADAGRMDSLAFIRELLLEGWGVMEEHIPVKQGRFDYRISVYRIKPPAAKAAGVSV